MKRVVSLIVLAIVAALMFCLVGCGGSSQTGNMKIDGVYSDITGIYDAENMGISKDELLAAQGDAKDIGYFVFVTIEPDKDKEQIGQDATATLEIGGNKYLDDYKVNQGPLNQVFSKSKYDQSNSLSQWPVRAGGNPAHVVFYFQGIVENDLDKEAILKWGRYTAKFPMSEVDDSCETPSDIVAKVG